jgi:signal transduction histidine kinase
MKTFIIFLSYTIILLLYFPSCKDFTLRKKKSDNSIKLSKIKTISFNNCTNESIQYTYKQIYNLKKIKNNLMLANIYFQMGHYYLNKNRSDSAFYYFNHAKEAFSIDNNSNNNNNIFIGKSLINMAIIQANEGDYIGSEETAVEALKYIKNSQNNTSLSAVYNCLAISKTEQKDYDQAIKYYNLALNFSTNKISEINIKNNGAVVNIKAGNYNNAIQILTNLSKDPFINNRPLLQARITDNLAYAKWLFNSNYKADKDFYQALEIRKKAFDTIGQIANHYHLSEYFEKTSIKKAIFHANKMYDIALKLGNIDDQLAAMQKIILLDTPSTHEKDYFNAYIKLSDKINLKRTQAKNQFALIRYDVERNKEENALLKAENAQKNYLLLKQKVMFGSATCLTILILILLIFWYRRRKAKFRQEKIEEVHRTKLKYSKKIHDEVANGIYFLMVQLENNSDAKPTKIIDELEILYHKSRDISHDAEFKIDSKEEFSITLRNMIKPYGAKNTRIILIGNEPHIWENISDDKKEEIYYILKELMTNMKKHSQADIVTLKFKNEDSIISIEYSDNGVGLAGSGDIPNKDLKNIKDRLNPIQGSFFIDHEKKIGLAIKIIISI